MATTAEAHLPLLSATHALQAMHASLLRGNDTEPMPAHLQRLETAQLPYFLASLEHVFGGRFASCATTGSSLSAEQYGVLPLTALQALAPAEQYMFVGFKEEINSALEAEPRMLRNKLGLFNGLAKSLKDVLVQTNPGDLYATVFIGRGSVPDDKRLKDFNARRLMFWKVLCASKSMTDSIRQGDQTPLSACLAEFPALVGVTEEYDSNGYPKAMIYQSVTDVDNENKRFVDTATRLLNDAIDEVERSLRDWRAITEESLIRSDYDPSASLRDAVSPSRFPSSASTDGLTRFDEMSQNSDTSSQFSKASTVYSYWQGVSDLSVSKCTDSKQAVLLTNFVLLRTGKTRGSGSRSNIGESIGRVAARFVFEAERYREAGAGDQHTPLFLFNELFSVFTEFGSLKDRVMQILALPSMMFNIARNKLSRTDGSDGELILLIPRLKGCVDSLLLCKMGAEFFPLQDLLRLTESVLKVEALINRLGSDYTQWKEQLRDAVGVMKQEIVAVQQMFAGYLVAFAYYTDQEVPQKLLKALPLELRQAWNETCERLPQTSRKLIGGRVVASFARPDWLAPVPVLGAKPLLEDAPSGVAGTVLGSPTPKAASAGAGNGAGADGKSSRRQTAVWSPHSTNSAALMSPPQASPPPPVLYATETEAAAAAAAAARR